MEREPSKPEINEDPINAQIEAAPSDIERINIILGLVHQGGTLSNEILERGLELCVANAFFIGAGKLALLLDKREAARDHFLHAIAQYKTHGYTEEAVGIARLMKEEGLMSGPRDFSLRDIMKDII